MINLNVLMSEIAKIRDAIDQVEAKGHANRSLLVFAYNNCNELLNQLGKILEEAQKQAEESQNSETTETPDNLIEFKEET